MKLADLTLRELRFLRDQVLRRNPQRKIDRAWLLGIGRQQWAEACELFAAMSRETAAAVLDELIASKSTRAEMLQLVWSGPMPQERQTRSTSVALRELFEQARQQVMVAGYSFDHGEEILAPLHHGMLAFDVQVEMFVHLPQPTKKERKTIEADNYVQARIRELLARNWPFGDPLPSIYYDKRVTDDVYCSLHAKCAVVDQRHVLIGSANFTNRGQHRNVEAGVLIDDAPFAETLVEHFHRLVGTGAFVRG